MIRFHTAILSFLSWLIICVSAASGEDSQRIAGHTIEEYAAQLRGSPSVERDAEHPDGGPWASGKRVAQLRAVRSLGAFGDSAGEVLRESLDHEDAAVRHIAAVQLGRIGGESLEKASTRLVELATDPSSLAVQLAASYALCRAGSTKKHLPLLIKTLEYPERGTACSAAYFFGNLGPSASAAIIPLEAAYAKNRPGAKGGDYHIGGAAMNALRKIRNAQD